MKSELFLVQRCEELIQKVYQNLSEQHENLPHEETIILVVFRKIVEKVDAANVLFENNCGGAIESIAREVLERYWHLCYLLEDDTSFRTLSYYYFDKLGTAKSIIENIEYSAKVMPELGRDIETIKKCEEMIEYLGNSPLFEEIRKEIQEKGNPNPKWYSLKSKNGNIKKLAQHLNLEDEYNAPYSLLSKETHGLTGTSCIKIEDGKALITPLRNIENGKEPLKLCHYHLSMAVKLFAEYFNLNDEFDKLGYDMSRVMHSERYEEMLKLMNNISFKI